MLLAMLKALLMLIWQFKIWSDEIGDNYYVATTIGLVPRPPVRAVWW